MRRPRQPGVMLLGCLGLLAGAAPPEKPQEGSLTVGDAAPAFALKDVDGKAEVKLTDLKGKPVVLVFGSCTWPPFRRSVGAIEKLHEKYKGKALLYVIYLREAHPTDGKQAKANVEEKVLIEDPRTLEKRQEVARDFARQFKVTLPILVDGLDDAVGKAYAGRPDRLYVIDAEGKVAYKGGKGPRGFKPAEVAPVLDKLLAEEKESRR